MKKGDTLLILLLVILIAGGYLYINNLKGDHTSAFILQNGKLIHEIELSSLEEPWEIRIEDGAGGYNIVRAEQGRIRVIEANCPEQVDVLQGWISEPHQSIVCLPHRLVIEIKAGKKSGVDAIVK